MAILVLGPTSVGKSSYIAMLRQDGKTVTPSFGVDIAASGVPDDGYIHYNILHRYLSCNGPVIGDGYVTTPPDALLQESILHEIISSGRVTEAIVLVAPVNELAARIQARQVVEEGDGKRYDAAFWLDVLAVADIFRLYELFFALFETRKIPYRVLFSTSADGQHAFLPTDRVFVHKHLKGQPCAVPLRESVQAVADSPFVEYQTVELPHAVTTPSKYGHLDDRDNFLSLLPDALAGKSVLDIGCAIGGLLIAAERLGAKPGVGVELNSKRYNGAMLVGRLLHTENTYHKADFLELPLRDAFDYVFCLNVIHHIEEYFAFLRKASALTKRAFILEYPTLADQRYAACHTLSPELVGLLEQQPLIGVSSATVDQTYTFTEKAMDAILFEKIGGFRGKETRPSSIEGRVLSVYYK
ncbi:hypothetical protein KL86DPRO_60179 [uncultured delta proteobacterium]|uniref:Methyltransferase domain-containing protein n=1 Tax=uncultured delta proteobacterium TaxID=34034 RepID=A0A212KFJ1_9DELT|nr:hypothetical protein KL86DPRO_60179 [uncultured delta proteobacterium]